MAMDNLNFDLRRFREDCLHLTQKELAGLLGLRQDSVSRMEQNPEQMTITTLVKLARLSGQSLDEVINYKPIQPQGLDVRRTWAAVQYNSANIQQLVQQEYGDPDSLLVPAHRDMVDGLQRLMAHLTRKPVLAVAGGFCSGKSTFINSLLGQPLLPVSAASSTLPPLRIRHVEDRPENFKSTVYFIRSGVKTTGADCSADAAEDGWLLTEGGPELLSSSGSNPEAGEILVYADSPVLRNCDIVRLPSPNFTGPAGPASIDVAPDILAYLCCGVQLPSASDASYFRLLLERTPMLERPDRPNIGCLSNLFIVCSKAHLLGSQEQAQDFAQKRLGSMLYNTLPPSFWEEREQITGAFCTEDFFSSRCFIYAVYDDPAWRTQLENALRRTLEQLPDTMRKDISRSMAGYRDAVCQELAAEAEQPAPALPEAASPWDAMRDPVRRDAVIQKQYCMMDEIDWCERESVRVFQSCCDKMMEEAHLKEKLEFFGKSRVQQLITELQTDMERGLNKILDKESQKLLEAREEYLSAFGSPDARAAFAKALLNFGRRGAFSRQIASTDALSIAEDSSPSAASRPASSYSYQNASLDSYKVVEVTSYYKRPGIFGAISNFLFGPALSNVECVSYLIDDASGTTSVKKTIKSIQTTFSNEIIPNYTKSIRRFWDDTRRTFQYAARFMQDTWEEALQNAEPKAAVSLEQSAREARELKAFLESLPL